MKMITEQFLSVLSDNLKRDQIRTNLRELELYSFDGLQLHKAIPGCVVLPESTEERLKLFKLKFSEAQKYAQKKEFTNALDCFKVSFKYLPNKTSKYAGICIGSAAVSYNKHLKILI